MDAIVTFTGWLLIDVLLIALGRLAVFIASLGRWRGDRLGGDEAKVHAAAGALSFVHEGRRVITRTGLLFAGLAFAVMVIVLIGLALARS